MVKKFELIDPAAKGILYALSERDKPSPIISIQMEVSEKGFASTTSSYSRIDKLIRLGLISEQKEVGRTARLLSLTEKGKKVVEYLKKIDKVMEG